MADCLEVYEDIVREAARECGPGADIGAIESAVQRRLAALPPDLRAEIESAIKRLTSFTGPGFHEHGSH